MVTEKWGEVAVGKPGLGVQSPEHGADAKKGRFEDEAVDGWVWRNCCGSEGDAGAQALTPEHKACVGGRGVGAGGVGEDGLGVEDEAWLRGTTGGGPVTTV